jgi:hypothetical protein
VWVIQVFIETTVTFMEVFMILLNRHYVSSGVLIADVTSRFYYSLMVLTITFGRFNRVDLTICTISIEYDLAYQKQECGTRSVTFGHLIRIRRYVPNSVTISDIIFF